LLLSGGLTKSPLVRHAIADVFGAEAVQPHQEEASALGAALLAAQSQGLIGSAVATAQAIGYSDPVPPNAACAASYRGAYERYRRLVGQDLGH
jgi:sugar (pentulose or hexulose) kinase